MTDEMLTKFKEYAEKTSTGWIESAIEDYW
jgi:hypothetical protein